eukprot:s4186_g3.t1
MASTNDASSFYEAITKSTRAPTTTSDSLELLTEIPTRLVKVGVGSLRLRDSAAAAGLLSFENAEQADRELASAVSPVMGRDTLRSFSPGVALRFILGRRDAELRAAESALAQVEARTPDLASIVRSLRQKVRLAHPPHSVGLL